MQLKVIESFVCLYHEKNISKASTKLYISQQGLSRQIQALESEWNVILFNRSNTGVEPTEACKLLYPHLKNMHEEYLLSMSVLNNYKKKKSKSYVVAFAYGITNSLSSDFIFDYQKQHPEVKLEIEEWPQSTCIMKLIKKELDAAFLVTPLDQKIIKCMPLIEGKLILGIHKNHPLASSDVPIELKYLNGEKIITGVPENAIRKSLEYYCHKSGIHLNAVVSLGDNLNFVNSMTENIGIAPLTQTMASKITNTEIIFRDVILPDKGYVYYCTPNNTDKCTDLENLQHYVENYFKTTPVKELLKNK